MFPVHEGEFQGFAVGRYSPQGTSAVYVELLTRAEELLSQGHSVILDASWIDVGRRKAAQDVASRSTSSLFEVCCQVRADIAEERIVHRLSEGLDASEATPEVRRAMARAMDPWASSLVIDTTAATAEESAARALEFVSQVSPFDGST
jgi:predicted kinase